MITTVISVRRHNYADRAALLRRPDFVYVGRRYGGWPASPFGNPWRVRDFEPTPVRTRAESCVDFYSEKLAEMLAFVRGEAERLSEMDPADSERLYRAAVLLPTLQGKILGCWCGFYSPGEPEFPCHAIILAKAANALPKE